MSLAANTYRYEDQFFLFDQMQYEVQYSLSKVDHSISENAEPDYGDDLVNEESDNKTFDQEESNDEKLSEGEE